MAIWRAAGIPIRTICFKIRGDARSSLRLSRTKSSPRTSTASTSTADTPWDRIVA